jgi:predicted ArsR family transcriptional regulator
MEKQTAVAALAALAHETRLDVFRLLVRAGSEGLAAGTVGEQLGIPAARLSFHLKELKGAGLVCCERDCWPTSPRTAAGASAQRVPPAESARERRPSRAAGHARDLAER